MSGNFASTGRGELIEDKEKNSNKQNTQQGGRATVYTNKIYWTNPHIHIGLYIGRRLCSLLLVTSLLSAAEADRIEQINN